MPECFECGTEVENLFPICVNGVFRDYCRACAADIIGYPLNEE